MTGRRRVTLSTMSKGSHSRNSVYNEDEVRDTCHDVGIWLWHFKKAHSDTQDIRQTNSNTHIAIGLAAVYMPLIDEINSFISSSIKPSNFSAA
jgi:hypothetical protein